MSTTTTHHKQNLIIRPAPFKPSYLSIPSSPFSPRTPLTPPAFPSTTSRTYPAPDPSARPPLSPLQWRWQCHQCHRVYGMGVTRRCLEDGHVYCAGITIIKNWRKARNEQKLIRHRPCGNEFDYQGWHQWGHWRRSGRRNSIYYDSDTDSDSSSSQDDVLEVDERKEEMLGQQKDCWNSCNYPSQCRDRKNVGIYAPVPVSAPTIPTVNYMPSPPRQSNTMLEGILKPENVRSSNIGNKKSEKTDFWGALLASAVRRKSLPPSSPLAHVLEEPEPGTKGVIKDKDGDVIMSGLPELPSTIDPQLLTSSVAATIAASAPIITFKDMMRKSKRRKTAGPKSPEPVAYVSHTAAAVETFEYEDQSLEDLYAEFPPLQRVRSRDSGYQSTNDKE